MVRDMRIYWMDFLASYTVVWAGGWLWVTASLPLALIGFLISALAAYRCGSFMHEIVHFDRRKKNEAAFKIVWNLLLGIPIMSPSHLYDSHLEHHMPDSFGTVRDPEYVPIRNRSLFGLSDFIFGHVMSPLSMVALRMLLNPVIWIFPALGRKLMQGKGTALVINWDYVPTGMQKPTAFDRFTICAATLLLYVYIALLITGILPLLLTIQIAAIIVLSMIMNGVRTLVAHRYINYSGESVNRQAQLTDSINLVGNRFWGGLFAPVGLRFHALHHLAQTLPYHNLEKAHLHLVKELAADDVYHSVSATIPQAMRELRQGYSLQLAPKAG